MAATFEGQIARSGGSWFMTMTICTDECEWTSQPVMLDSDTEVDAKAEALAKLAAAKAAITGG